MRALSISGVTCPYFLLGLAFTFIAISPRATSYAIPSTFVVSTVNNDGMFLLEAREPTFPVAPQTSSNFDDALPTTLDLNPLPESTTPSSIGDDDQSTLSNSDILSSAADSLSSTADSLLSTASTLSSTADNLFSTDSSSPSTLDSLTSTANSLSSTADVIDSTADLLSSNSHNIYSIDGSLSGKDDGLLLASGEEPHCDGGVALCCNGVRLLDGALVEHCSYWSTNSPCMATLEVDCCEDYISEFGCMTSMGLHCTRTRL